MLVSLEMSHQRQVMQKQRTSLCEPIKETLWSRRPFHFNCRIRLQTSGLPSEPAGVLTPPTFQDLTWNLKGFRLPSDSPTT